MAAALAGCAGLTQRLAQPTSLAHRPREAEPRPRAEAAWATLRSAQFTLHSDLSAAEARATIADLERARVALLRWWDLPTGTSAPLEVVIFAHELDYQQRMGRDGGHYVLRAGDGGVLLASSRTREAVIDGEMLMRGLAHHHLRQAVGALLPAWLEEGVVAYLGRLHVDGATAKFAGLPAPLPTPTPLAPVPTAELFAGTSRAAPGPAARTTVTAFALAHHLLDEELFGTAARARLQEWLRLVGARTMGVTQALATVYPELVADELDAALAGRLRRLGLATEPRTFVRDLATPPAEEVTVAPLEAREHERVMARVQNTTPEGRARLHEESALKTWVASHPLNQLRLDAYPPAPRGCWTLGYGRALSEHHAFDFEVGSSPFGPAASVRYRFQMNLTRALYLSGAVGPWLALQRESLGLWADPESLWDEDSFHHFGVSPEFAVGGTVYSALLLRLSLTFVMKTSSNMEELCRNHRYMNNQICFREGAFGRLPHIAAEDSIAFLRLGVGYVW